LGGSRCFPEFEIHFVATDETDNNRGTAKHGDIFEPSGSYKRYWIREFMSSRNQSEIQTAVKDSSERFKCMSYYNRF
jgi:hypothetical protein